MRAIEKPTFKVLNTVAGPVAVPLNELFDRPYSSWRPAELWRSQWRDLEPGGTLVVDDTVNAKENTICTEAAYPNFSGQHHRVVRGQTFVTILYVPPKGAVRLLWMQMWRPGGPNKLELVRDAIADLLDAGVQPHDVVFDGWYFDPGFVRWLDARDLVWTTRARRNLKFYFDGGRECTLEGWAKDVPMSSWHHYADRKIYAKAANIAKHGFKPVKLLAFKHERHGKVDRFLLTNDLQAGNRTILARYGKRWAIETVYRFTKQRLGFSTYRHHSADAAERHVALVSIVYNFLAQLAKAIGIPIGRLKVLAENPTRTDGVRALKVEIAV